MDFELKDLRGPKGIIVGIAVVVLALGYHQWRRSSLKSAATAEARKFLKVELPARYVRETTGALAPDALESLSQITIMSVDLPLFAGERPRVRVRASDGNGTEYGIVLRLKRGIGSWRLISARLDGGS